MTLSLSHVCLCVRLFSFFRFLDAAARFIVVLVVFDMYVYSSNSLPELFLNFHQLVSLFSEGFSDWPCYRNK